MPRLNLLKTPADFSQFRVSKSYQVPSLRLRIHIIRNQNLPRFGFIIPKKVLPKVVDRNKLKRRLKTVLQKHHARLKPANFLFFPNASLLKKSYADLAAEVEQLFTKANLWKF